MSSNIYIIKNTANNKIYVGQSIDVEKRYVKHLSDSKSKDCKSVIRGCLNKTHICYNFEWNILEGQTTIESIAV